MRPFGVSAQDGDLRLSCFLMVFKYTRHFERVVRGERGRWSVRFPGRCFLFETNGCETRIPWDSLRRIVVQTGADSQSGCEVFYLRITDDAQYGIPQAAGTAEIVDATLTFPCFDHLQLAVAMSSATRNYFSSGRLRTKARNPYRHMNLRSIRASFDEESIVVYQAFNPQIGEAAVEQQSFLNTPFKQERMTWIKPSFLWMMYRSDWGRKPDQEVVLGVRIKRGGFEWALRNAALASFDRHVYTDQQQWKERIQATPVRVQWDPEKDIHLQPLDYRSIQIGISGIAVSHYINEWIISIENLSPLATKIHQLLRSGNDPAARVLLPQEMEYPLLPEIASIIGAR